MHKNLLRSGATRVLIVFGTGHDFSGHATSEDQVTFSRMDIASDHVVLDGTRYPRMPISKPFEEYDSNWSAALCEHGIVRRETPIIIDIIADEQRKILRHLSENGTRLTAW